MKQIRGPLVGLVALFVGALVLDRLALDRASGRTISTPTYLASLALTAAPLAVPLIRRLRGPTLLILAAGGAAVLEVLAGRLTADPYQAAVETAFVTLAAGLSHRLAAALQQIDETIDTVVFGDNPALPLDGRRAGTEILGEMARSRRHGRPLSVTVLAPDAATLETAVDRATEDVQRAVRARYVHGQIARMIAEQLRRSDLLFEDPSTGNFVVVSPETSSEGSALLVERIARAVQHANVRLDSGQATFPDQALTFEQLIEAAQARMATADSQPASRPGAA